MAPSGLTRREKEVRRLAVEGLTNEAIAAELGISARTVEAHLRMLFSKLGVTRREDLDESRAPARRADADMGTRFKDLQRSLELHRLQIRAYDAAMRRLADRQFPLFDERIEITVVVGRRSSEDRVIERHWTTPDPYLVYRVLRPITPLDMPYSERYAETLAMTVDVRNTDVDVSADLMSDGTGRALVLVTFQPGLRQSTEWELRYRTPGMWDPLRENGVDDLGWSAGTLDGRHLVGVNDMVLRVELPAGTSAYLEESRGVGEVERTSSGDAPVLVFHDRSRTGGFYLWTLRIDAVADGGEARSVLRGQPPPVPFPPNTSAP